MSIRRLRYVVVFLVAAYPALVMFSSSFALFAKLIGSLGAVAETMRNCAAIADQFSQMLAHGHVNFNGAAPLHMMPPGLNAAIADPKQFFALPSPAAATPAERKRKAEAQDPDEDGKKKKRGSVKKPKDPNAPKRPASSYIFFQNEIRSQLKSKHPNMTQHELLNHISKQWSEMTPPQRDVSVASLRLSPADAIPRRSTKRSKQPPRPGMKLRRRCMKPATR